jgi:glycosyltransferase involved in cell wall biosynthesis
MNSFFQKKTNIIFILPNIFETISGVSNKYKKFIEYLSSFNNLSIKIILTRSKDNKNSFPIHKNVKYFLTKGIRIPYYKEIKVPILNKSFIEEHIISKNEIIIFHGEFIWLYEPLLKLKKKYPEILLIPNWHTDYEYYLNNVYKIFKFSSSFIHHLHFHLQNNDFSGIIVTGKKMEKKYLHYTSNIINVNELDVSIFNSFKFNNYHPSIFHFIYTGRISKEKNIDFLLNLLPYIEQNTQNFKFHFIGDGPFLEELKQLIKKKYNSSQVIFYGSLQPSEIRDIYLKLENRIFIFPSTSETFGKSPLEAAACGIPLFIMKSDVSDDIYIHRKNAFIFKNEREFIQEFIYFQNLDKSKKEEFIHNTIDNAFLYDQQKIFKDWYDFLLNLNQNKKLKLNILNHVSFKSFNELIQCSNNIFGEN